jgi:hypothetical protein
MQITHKPRALGRVAVIAVAILMAISSSAGIASASTATATSISASCYGDGCGGKSPQAEGCSADGRTLAEFIMDGVAGYRFRVEMRYSAVCHASWTRLSNVGNPDCLISAKAWHWAYQNGTGINNFTKRVSIAPSCATTTVMMSKVGRVNRACGIALYTEYCTPPK